MIKNIANFAELLFIRHLNLLMWKNALGGLVVHKEDPQILAKESSELVCIVLEELDKQGVSQN